MEALLKNYGGTNALNGDLYPKVVIVTLVHLLTINYMSSVVKVTEISSLMTSIA